MTDEGVFEMVEPGSPGALSRAAEIVAFWWLHPRMMLLTVGGTVTEEDGWHCNFDLYTRLSPKKQSSIAKTYNVRFDEAPASLSLRAQYKTAAY